MTDAWDSDRALRLLVAYRLVVYVGGLLAIAAPIVLARVAGVVVPEPVRTAVVIASLGAMLATYIAEQWTARGATGRTTPATAGGNAARAEDTDPTGGDRAEYSLRRRLVLVGAVIGLAVGVYVAVEVDLLYGSLFLLGALLFVRVAFGRGGE